jgi:hypothetical protein
MKKGDLVTINLPVDSKGKQKDLGDNIDYINSIFNVLSYSEVGGNYWLRVSVPSLPDYDWLDATRTDRYPLKNLNKLFTKSNSSVVELRSTEFYYRKKSFSGLTYIPYPGRSIFGTGLVVTLFNATEGTVPPDSFMNWLKANADYYGFAWTDKLVGDPRFPYVLHYYKGLERPQYLWDKFINTPNPSLPPISGELAPSNPSIIPVPGTTTTTLPPRGSVEITIGNTLKYDLKSLKVINGRSGSLSGSVYSTNAGKDLLINLEKLLPKDIVIDQSEYSEAGRNIFLTRNG